MTSIFRYSKNYGSLTHETRIKDAVNMENLICLLATVRTLKDDYCTNTVVVGDCSCQNTLILKRKCYVNHTFTSFQNTHCQDLVLSAALVMKQLPSSAGFLGEKRCTKPGPTNPSEALIDF